MKNWSYRVLEFHTRKGLNFGGLVNTKEIEDSLNMLGNQGWEVISGYTTNVGYGTTKRIIYTLKRED